LPDTQSKLALFQQVLGIFILKMEITPPPELSSEVGSVSTRDDNFTTFLAVLKWMWHLALEAGKVFQTASM
jgi:hypothetical protein